MKNRTTVINHLIKENNYKSYLEIGVHDKRNFNQIICDQKISVDPKKSSPGYYDFNITSDEFFEKNTQKFDVIFIDGLHTAEQVEKDIDNSLKILNVNGVVVIHDTNPPTEFHQMEKQENSKQTPAKSAWNGSVWKAIFLLRKSRKDLVFKTFSFDSGVTMIKFGDGEIIDLENKYFSFNIFDENRKKILNFID